VYHVEQGLDVSRASEKVMSELRQKTSGEAGLILADSKGNVSVRFDTPHMPTSVLSTGFNVPYTSMIPKWP
jgi:isoaspartyl peptidase/L-asparaginase-like protein (Ntn-hydrolase superfamily)